MRSSRLRVLMVADNTPSTDPARGDGSTMISAHLLRHMPEDLDVNLVYFRAGDASADPEALERARTVHELPVRSRRSALLAQPLTRLPRATWQRRLPKARLLEWSRDADVLYLHGLHVMHLGLGRTLPIVAHEVDPWSEYWRQRAETVTGARRWYDALQSRRAARLENSIAAGGATIVVVNESDARLLRQRTNGRVVAVSNGVEPLAPPAQELTAEPLLAFVGSLDYPPNVEALTRLATEVWPLIRRAVPDARIVVAGRRATAEVQSLSGSGIEVVGEVDDVTAVFRAARASLYPGVTGRGTKNSVTESFVAGCPVVASVESARGQLPGEHLLVGSDATELARLAIGLLTDEEAAMRAREACRAVRTGVKTWQQSADEMASILREAAGR